MPLTKKGNALIAQSFTKLSLLLSSTEPAYDGSNVTEPGTDAGLNYERVPASMVTFAESNGYISNTNYIYFPEATGDWGELGYYALANSSGVIEYYGTLETPIHPTENTIAVIKPDALKLRMN